MSTKNETALQICLILLSIPIAIGSFILHGFTLAQGFNWLLVPELKVPELTFTQGLIIYLLLGILPRAPLFSEEKKEEMGRGLACVVAHIAYVIQGLIMLFVFWLVHVILH